MLNFTDHVRNIAKHPAHLHYCYCYVRHRIQSSSLQHGAACSYFFKSNRVANFFRALASMCLSLPIFFVADCQHYIHSSIVVVNDLISDRVRVVTQYSQIQLKKLHYTHDQKLWL